MATPKFRIWDKGCKVWATDFTISLHGELLCDNGSTFFIRDDFVLMQWTGLPDKDGAQIWGADVISFDNECISAMRQVGWVRFQESAYAVLNHDNKVIMPLYAAQNVKVIGNIYENPELLNEVES